MNHRKTPYDDQLDLEASKRHGETPAEHVARLRGMTARGHDGARRLLKRLEGSFAGQLFAASQRGTTTKLRSV